MVNRLVRKGKRETALEETEVPNPTTPLPPLSKSTFNHANFIIQRKKNHAEEVKIKDKQLTVKLVGSACRGD